MRLALILPTLLALASPARATPTTLGVEWEQKHHGFDFSAVSAELPPRYPDKALIEEKLVCSTAMAGSIPLVSLSYDMAWRSFAENVRTLEIVTGPVDATGSRWAEITSFLRTVYAAVEDGCSTRTYKDGYKQVSYCTITAKDLVDRINATAPGSATLDCYGSADPRNLRKDAAGLIRLIVPGEQLTGQEVTFKAALAKWSLLRLKIDDGFRGANTQVSIGIDLENVTLDTLMTKNALFHEATPGYRAFKYFEERKRPSLQLDANEKAFLSISYYVFHTYLEWLHTHPDRFPKDVTPIAWDYSDWMVKNTFGLLPKAPLNEIYKRVRSTQLDTVMADPRLFCDEDPLPNAWPVDVTGPASKTEGEASKRDETEVDARKALAVVKSKEQWVKTCTGLHKLWTAALAQDMDLFASDRLMHVIPVISPSRVVFEMRDPSIPLVQSRRLDPDKGDDWLSPKAKPWLESFLEATLSWHMPVLLFDLP